MGVYKPTYNLGAPTLYNMGHGYPKPVGFSKWLKNIYLILVSHISLSLFFSLFNQIYIYIYTYISFAPPTSKDPENHNFTEERGLSTLPFGNTTRSTQLRKVMARAQEMKPHIWDHSPLMRLAAWMALDSSTPFWRISLLGITVMLCPGHRPKSHIILHDIVPVIKNIHEILAGWQYR